MAKSKKKPVKFHSSHSFNFEGQKFTFIFQLYTVGIYGVLNVDGDHRMQGSYTPKEVIMLEKDVVKRFEEGEIQDLKFGVEIVAQENSHGLYERIYPENTNK